MTLIRFGAALSFGILVVGYAAAGELDQLHQGARLCQEAVMSTKAELDRVIIWTNVFMIVGALTAAVGSGLAGFMKRAHQRKVAAVVGALGAVVSVLPKALPDRQTIEKRFTLQESHRLIGDKLLGQLEFAEIGESTTRVRKYIAARFADCASANPTSPVPEFQSSKGSGLLQPPNVVEFEALQAP